MNTILQKRSIAPAKLDEVKVKANILNAFKTVVEKAEETVEEAKEATEEVKEKAEEVVGRASAEL